MKRCILLCVVAVLACGVAQATNYEWNGGSGTFSYDNPAAWTPSAVPGASDAIHLGVGAVGGTVQFINSTTMNIGSVTIDNGTLDHSNGPGTLVTSGDFIVRNNGSTSTGVWYGRGGIATLNIGGNLRIDKVVTNDYSWNNLILSGSGTLDARDGGNGGRWANATVGTGASYATAATNQAPMSNLEIDGTVTGGTWTVMQDSNQPGTVGNFVQFGASGSMTGGEIVIDVLGGSTTSTLSLGGGTYTKLTVKDSSGGVETNRRTIRMKGDVTVTSDFTYDHTVSGVGSGYGTGSFANFTTDNGSGRISNLTVNGAMDIGGPKGNEGYPGGAGYLDGFTANSSTVTVKGAATFEKFAYIQGGTSTWKFGGNVQFTSQYLFDCSDLSSTTFVMNGTGPQSLSVGDCAPLGNIEINTNGAAVSLGADLVLNGNFKVTAGAFNNNGFYVVFAGKHNTKETAEQLDAKGLDLGRVHIMDPLATPSFVILMSDLTVSDNLDIDAGCELFLNGHNLFASTSDVGQNFSGSFTGTYQVKEGGLIVGNIPEPATLLLLGTGALGAIGYIRRQRVK